MSDTYWQHVPSNRPWIIAGLVALVLTLFVGCPCGGVLVWRVFFYRSPSQKLADDFAENVGKAVKSASESQAERERKEEEQRVAAVLNHVWWKKPLTKIDLDNIIDYLIATSSGNWVFVDSGLRTARIKDDDWAQAMAESVGVASIVPKEMNKARFLSWRISQLPKRWDRTEALQALKQELDRRELKDGPGR